MNLRFVSNLLFAFAGGLVAVVSMSLGAGVTGWITLGVSLGILIVLCVSEFDPARGMFQRALDAPTAVLGIWAIIASLVFSGSALTWLSFAEGLGFAGLALIGLIAHELLTERVVHSLAPADEMHSSAHYSQAA